jgi:NADPH-dependent ferric siderophore reductase
VSDDRVRLRREPPRFRLVTVRRVEPVTPRMVRITFGGRELDGFVVDEPAASVRVLLPSPGADELVMPAWNGNEFLLPDGTRPIIRTFTPRPVDAADELEVDVVLHGEGAASSWASTARPGAAAAISGPGRGFGVDADAPAYLVAGDETAIPAITQVLAALPEGMPVDVHVEIAYDDARQPLGRDAQWHVRHDGARAGDALVAAVEQADLAPEARVWAAGEAAAVQRIRRHLFDACGIPRSRTSVRGYWKHGRAGEGAA